MSTANGNYYLPNPSPWPVITSAGLFSLALGFILTMNGIGAGSWVMLAGAAVIVYVMFRWFGQVIGESESGTYNQQVDRSFRWGMAWFIFSEVMFFAAFFGALLYVRQWSVEWIGANELLWPGYDATWPTAGPKGPMPAAADSIPGPSQFSPMGAWGIPAINTLILLSSGATVTWAHWGLLKNNRSHLVIGLFLTVALGLMFLALQTYEYAHAYKGARSHAQDRRLRRHVLHAHRLPRLPRDHGHDHADRHSGARAQGPLPPRSSLRFRGRGLVLALRGRRLVVPVYLRIRAVTARHGRKKALPVIGSAFLFRSHFKMKLTARTPGTPGMGIPGNCSRRCSTSSVLESCIHAVARIAFSGDPGALAVRNHIHFVTGS